MNVFGKRISREGAGWRKHVLKIAKQCKSANELCQWVAEEISKPIYPLESLELPASGKLLENDDYFLILYQPAPRMVSEMSILHELTHILFRKCHLQIEEGEVERFAFELFRRIYEVNKLFSPIQNSPVVARYESLLS
ncbi:hypothetical protein HYR99_12115 [Candidatus Poribacteria bacterium]|nr:hypothetical protein [Candidatus Poribacteria bacterium]